MAAPRGEFTSRFGFIMAAAGSAVGLGNIWGFPTQAASNGGAAFLLVYLIMAFCLAYPVLMAEFIIGRHAKANAVTALQMIANNDAGRLAGRTVGIIGIITASLILSFYGIVAGWLFSHALASTADLVGSETAAAWFRGGSFARDFLFMAIFMAMTVSIICGGVKNGIEAWCRRLMPALLTILGLLIVYVLTLDGAMDGLRAYLVPDFKAATNPDLVVRAMGQAFFSLSLGVGTMLIYGSYVNDRENLVSLGRSVALVDVGIAVFAGLLIIPAMYVALHNGVVIFDDAGKLIEEDSLIFNVLPALFETMGGAGVVVSILFFLLMSIAALTSTISILEVPVAYTVEHHEMERKRATYILGTVIGGISTVIIIYFEQLFGLVVALTTRYSQPLLGLMLCVFAAWIWHRNGVLKELQKNDPNAEHGWFWKIWPNYVRFVCPAAIIIVFARQFLS